MEAADRLALEQALGEAHTAGEHERAATLIIQGYGPEILGFLIAMVRNGPQAEEVFSQFCENLWRGLPSFDRRCSFRTWLYTVARNALRVGLRGDARRGRRLVPLSPGLSLIEQQVRARTLGFLRSQVRDRMTQLREELPTEDQALLILRVDKQLEWNELAQVLSEADDLSAEALRRDAARLRKRFQVIKEKLRKRLEEEGLLDQG